MLRLLALPLLTLTFASATTFAQSVGMFAMANPSFSPLRLYPRWKFILMTDSKTGGQYGLCRINPKETYEEWCLYRKDMNIDTKDCSNPIILLKDKK